MFILGIDPSLTKTGYCVLDNTKEKEDSVIDVGLIKTIESTLEILRYDYISKSLQKIIKKYNIKRIGSESPIFHAQQSENLFALYSFIKMMLFKNKLDVVYFAPRQLKKLARLTAIKKVTKQDMITAMKKRLGLKKAKILNVRIQGDIADAYHVAHFADRFWKIYDKKLIGNDLTDLEKETFIDKPIFKRGLAKGIEKPGKQGILHRENEHFYRFSDAKTRRVLKK